MSETLVNKPQRVYWHRGQYQYKASAADRKNGFKAWTPLGPDLATAIEKYDRLHRLDNEHIGSVNWLIDWYMEEIAPAILSERTMTDRKACFKKLKVYFKDTDASRLKPHHIQQYVSRRATEAPRRARMEYVSLSQVFRFARRWGFVAENPATDIFLPKTPPRDRYVTHDELQTFVKMNDSWAGPMALLGYALGQRLSDILALTYNSNELIFKTQKTKKRACIQMTAYLERLIRRINPKVEKGELIVLNQAGGAYDRHSFGHRWRRAMNRFVEAGGERFTFHDLKAKIADGKNNKDRLHGKNDSTLHVCFAISSTQEIPFRLVLFCSPTS